MKGETLDMLNKILYNSHIIGKGCANIHLYRTINMCTFIKMEHLVASALVELYEKKQIDTITLAQIRNYGIKVEEQLNSQDNTRAILLFSNNYTKEFLQDYSDYFELVDNSIKIKNGVEIDDIREHILSYISAEILFALLDQKVLQVIDAA